MVTAAETIFGITPIYGLSLNYRIRQILHKSLCLCYFHVNNYLHRMGTIMHLQMTNRTESMLRITTEKKRGKTFLSVEGRLAGPWVARMNQCWRESCAVRPPWGLCTTSYPACSFSTA